jgi:hypothetical protein
VQQNGDSPRARWQLFMRCATGAAKRSAHTQAATIPAQDFRAVSRINHTDKYALLYTSNALLLAELPSSGKTCATKANCKQPTRPRTKPSLGVVFEFTYPQFGGSGMKTRT